MIINSIKSLIENIKERINNPFIEKNTTPFAGTYIFSIVAYNWKLIFSLFNFDSNESRERKIEIISDYLRCSDLTQRFGYPLLIAFGVIIFYYFFNYVSLGLTTFFNRWFKATILYFTDKSKIIAREELEKTMSKMNITRLKYEELRKTFSESQSELELYKSRINEEQLNSQKLNSELAAKNTSFNETKQELNELKNYHNNLRIVYAHYGKDGTFKDVTQELNSKLSGGKSLIINNENLGGDPLKYVYKELLVIYEINRKIERLKAYEHEIIEILDNKVFITETNISKGKKAENELSNIFSGNWLLRYTDGKTSHEEAVSIDKKNRYLTDGKHSFNLKNVSITGTSIKFDKIKLDKVKHSSERLTVDTPTTIRGVDNLGFKLEYIKQTI